MGRHSKPSNPLTSTARVPKVTAALTLCVDIRDDGEVVAVVGRMDMASRRYVFTRYDGVITDTVGLLGCAEAMRRVAAAYEEDLMDEHL